MADEYLLSEIKDRFAVIVINRPHKMNALSDDLIWALAQQFEQLAADRTVRAVIVRGSGEKAFCSGYDIGALTPDRGRPTRTADRTEHPLEPAACAIAAYPYPVIAMLNGDAFGAGCELAVCCDIRIAAEDIRMGMPPARIGVVYPWTGLQRFVQAVGWNHTREMFFSGETVKGERLRLTGLVNHLVARDSLEAFTIAMAKRIAGNAPLALKGIKKTLNLLARNMMAMASDDIAENRAAILKALHSEDLIEGQRAFRERRTPHFKGI
jgi:enoyl-CoA hydratase/carnithine racemase